MTMKKQFKCTLMSDVVLSESSATEGQHHCLDFIPGNNFLGIVAAALYQKEDAEAYTLFHSGKVRFGDAHPSDGGTRGVRIPASLFYPKLGTLSDGCYVHHHIPQPMPEDLRKMQLKQCRKGFYVFDENNQAFEVRVDKEFAIKSAYDSQKRRSEDEKMFGYESIAKDTVLYFDVEFDDDAAGLADKVAQALCGNRHVGRSRSAQYGWVKIEPCKYAETPSAASQDGIVTVYANGRLVFFDDNGLPTFRPTPADLGIDDAHARILWDKSQIRIFQYAPWNYKRQAFDHDRCGIEKGSVIVVETSKKMEGSRYVGAFCNEGFGKVDYNPVFLQADKDGKSVVTFVGSDANTESNGTKTDTGTPANAETSALNSTLLAYLEKKAGDQVSAKGVYEKVEAFVENILPLFRNTEAENVKWNSQWGTIRSIAMSNAPDKIITEIEKYISRGVTKEQWEERGRKDTLLERLGKEYLKGCLKDFVINLSSEMAKKLAK